MRSINDIKSTKKDFIINGIMKSNGLYCLIAYPKVGKSMLALQLSDCIANNKPFLGCETNFSSVLYISTENSGSQLFDRMNMMNIKFKDNDFQFIDRDEYSKFFLKDLEVDIKTFSLNEGRKLLIIDMLKDIEFDFGYDMNNYQDIGQNVLPKLRQLCSEYNIAILFIHHLNKKGKSLGSTAFDGSVDGTLRLEQSQSNKNNYRLSIINRDYESLDLSLKKDNNCILNICEEKIDDDYINPVLIALVKYCSQNPDIELTATELANKLSIPTTARQIGILMKNNKDFLKKEGLHIENKRNGKQRLKHIKYEEPIDENE